MDEAEQGRVEITIDPSGGEYRVKIQRCALGQLITVLKAIIATLESPGRLPFAGVGAERSGDGTLH